MDCLPFESREISGPVLLPRAKIWFKALKQLRPVVSATWGHDGIQGPHCPSDHDNLGSLCYLLPGAMGKSGIGLLPKIMYGSLALLQPEPVLMSMALDTIKG